MNGTGGYDFPYITPKMLDEAFEYIKNFPAYRENLPMTCANAMKLLKAGMRPNDSCRWLLVGGTEEERAEVYALAKKKDPA